MPVIAGVIQADMEKCMCRYRDKSIFAALTLAALMLTACTKQEQGNRVVFTPDVENQSTQVADEKETVNGGELEEFLPGEENWGETVEATTAYVNEATGVEQLKAAVSAELGDAFWPDTDVKSLEAVQITQDMYDEFVYTVTSDESKADEIIIVKAKDGRIDEVIDKLNLYRDSKINDYNVSDDDIIKIQCSQVISVGNYAAFIQLGAEHGQSAAESKKTLSEDESAQAEMDAIEEQNNLAAQSILNALSK